ncbi:hypothetical protein PtrM4_059310 [Pyrenophora tritici-repentis]|uniref:Uncharacterized protein n=1 Tax=Pyrenophora tritici-repentis TaxID=45151 RepID=A0A2W1H2N0_9PLEO|nr:hypothetical protein A1F99_043330 [Pyrenophora tritici-repentis]KAF7574308.1 hypothetical protein PtrM4_059310 [Pyrenophora tritici-repentis]KAI0586914.1 hypothetical protein Alg215_01795 [Pyrenophora tritici-repentis]KAI1518401.1 hypothetical protein Ptr86124_001529 [Pyrenophora tritici-repentis]KAI1584504.1 hypothetical protein PtrEW13061_008415 [Pyrenophora tritici-repentis]
MVALDVSERWRSCAVSVISSSRNAEEFRFPSVCEPIKYGQLIEFELPELKPGPDEISVFRVHLHRLLERRRNTMNQKYLYFPARLTQQRDLPDDIAQTLNALDVEQMHELHGVILSVSRDTNVSWLDLSQVHINPYFHHLFARDGRIQHVFGRWEIKLRSPSDIPLIKRTPNTNLLIDLIGSMHITYPLCKTLGIYHTVIGTEVMMSSPSQNAFISRVHNDDGIRVSELIDALELCAPGVVSDWKRDVGRFHDYLVDESLPATPTIIICMDNSRMPAAKFDYHKASQIFGSYEARTMGWVQMGYSAHITRVAYLAARPFHASREGEWLPKELFEPMMTETGHSPINWDT